jgi:PAS domain S-box-containing protein
VSPPFWKPSALLRALACTGLLSAAYGTAFAQQLPVKSYTTVDGLAHDRVMRIVRDSRGFLWFCTVDGLSRFDGAEFTTYRTEQGLPFPFINDLLEIRPGEYWLATNGGGVVRLDLRNDRGAAGRPVRSRFTAYAVAERPAANRVHVLRRDRSGCVWAGTESGLFSVEESGTELRFRAIDLGPVSTAAHDVVVGALLEDRGGSLWIGTSEGVVRRSPDGRFSHYAGASGFGERLVRSLLEDTEGNIWMSQQATLTVLESHSLGVRAVRRFTAADGLVGEIVRTAFRSAEGRIWIGSSAALNELHGSGFYSYTEAQGVGGAINSLAEDSEGNLWIGTDLVGALRVARNGFVSFNQRDGLLHPWITSIFESAAGELHAAGGGELTVSRFDGRRFVSVAPRLPATVGRTSAFGPRPLMQDHAGEWWAGTSGGLYRFGRLPRIEELARVQPKTVYGVRQGLPTDDVAGLFEDSHGDLWVTTTGPAGAALTRWQRATGTFERYGEREGWPRAGRPSAIGEDAHGNLWIGFRDGGLARHAHGRSTLFTKADGLPAGEISTIHLDRSRRLWVASTEGGLASIEDPTASRPRFVVYTTAQGLSSNWIRCLAEDKWGRLYLGTVRGIDRLTPETGRVKHYDTADGLAGSEVLAAFADRGGSLWFGTFQGLSRFRPEPDRPRPPPTISITGLRIAGVAQPVFELGESELPWRELGPDQDHVEVRFFGLGEALRYQYKLEGPDRAWSVPSAQRMVDYPSLAPGTYRFLVRAVDADGVVSPQPASLSFTILPPLWRRLSFIAVVAVLVGSAVLAFRGYRAARIKELKAALGDSQALANELSVQRADLSQAHQVLALEYAITGILAEAATPVQAAPRILRAICESFGWQLGAIWDVDPQTHVLHCMDVWHESGAPAAAFAEQTRGTVFPPGEGLPGRVLQSGQAHWITELSQDDNFPRSAAAAQGGLRSAVGLPVLLRGEVVGVLEFFSRDRRDPHAEQIRMMSTIGSDVGQLMQRKRAEEALRESELRFRTFAETASDAIVTVDGAGTIVFVNPATERVFGHPAGDLVGEDLVALMPEYMRHAHRAGFERYQQTGRRHLSWIAVELPGLHRDGHEIPLEVSFGEFASDGRRYFTGIVRDVRDRKRAEEALRRSREERLAELERVRKRIATDLHDDIGSSLTRISILSEVVRQRVDRDDSPVTGPLSVIAESSRDLVDAMSDIVWAINPKKDHLHDLTQRMRRFAADTFTARNITLRMRLPDAEEEVPLGANLRREVFLIFKEAVNNMVRHAACTEAEVELTLDGGRLRLRLRDNGEGFDPDQESEGHGLLSMRDRARGIGGEFRLSSRPGHGTIIELSIALERPSPV